MEVTTVYKWLYLDYLIYVLKPVWELLAVLGDVDPPVACCTRIMIISSLSCSHSSLLSVIILHDEVSQCWYQLIGFQNRWLSSVVELQLNIFSKKYLFSIFVYNFVQCLQHVAVTAGMRTGDLIKLMSITKAIPAIRYVLMWQMVVLTNSAYLFRKHIRNFHITQLSYSFSVFWL